MPIAFRGVWAGYRRREYILKDVTCDLEPPTIILGPNGAGKTTLFRVILGLTPISQGKVLIDDEDINKIYGRPGLVSTNLREVYMLLYTKLIDIAKLYIAIVGGNLSKFLSLVKTFNIEHLLDKTFDKMSAGELRLALNALALSLSTKYVLLDEPFENLDPRQRVRMLKLIQEERHRVIMNTHATWLLDKLEGWKAYVMINGRLFGPLDATELPNLGLEKGEAPDAKLVLEVDSEKYSLVVGRGLRLSTIDSLDRLYEVIAG